MLHEQEKSSQYCFETKLPEAESIHSEDTTICSFPLRLSMMFLRTNETALLERIKTTGLDVNGDHRKKIRRLLVRMAPSVQSTSKQESNIWSNG
jgi:hypothetical protein